MVVCLHRKIASNCDNCGKTIKELSEKWGPRHREAMEHETSEEKELRRQRALPREAQDQKDLQCFQPQNHATSRYDNDTGTYWNVDTGERQ